MSVTSTRQITLTQIGDNLNNSISVSAASNGSAPGDIDVFGLSAGDNTLTLPTGGTTPSGATLIPPAGNTQTLTLKGVGGDTGIRLSKVDPTSISFDSAALPANIIVNAGGTVNGFRVVWT